MIWIIKLNKMLKKMARIFFTRFRGGCSYGIDIQQDSRLLAAVVKAHVEGKREFLQEIEEMEITKMDMVP